MVVLEFAWGTERDCEFWMLFPNWMPYQLSFASLRKPVTLRFRSYFRFLYEIRSFILTLLNVIDDEMLRVDYASFGLITIFD